MHAHYFTNSKVNGDVVMVVGNRSTAVQVNGEFVSIAKHSGALGECLRLAKQGWVFAKS